MHWPQPGLPQPVHARPPAQPNYYTERPCSNPNSIIQRTFAIPVDTCGTIIGKGGHLINGTRKATGATIKLMSPQAGAPSRMVMLSGTPAQVRNAYYNILGQLEGHLDTVFFEAPQVMAAPSRDAVSTPMVVPSGGAMATPSGDAMAAPSGDAISTLMAVDRDMVGGLIGKGGVVINRIRSVSGANIKISKTGECSEPSKRLITIWGAKAVVERAQLMITQQLSAVANAATPGGDPAVTAPSGPQLEMTPGGEVTFTMPLDDEVAGLLIGRAGANINSLRQRSGAQIKIGDRVSGQQRQITVTGNAQQLQLAQALITSQLLERDAATKETPP